MRHPGGGELWKAQLANYQPTQIDWSKDNLKILSDIWENAKKLTNTEGKATDAFLNELEKFEAFKPFADDLKNTPDKIEKVGKALDLGLNVATILPLIRGPLKGLNGESIGKFPYKFSRYSVINTKNREGLFNKVFEDLSKGRLKYVPDIVVQKGPISKRFDSFLHFPNSVKEATGVDISLGEMSDYRKALSWFRPYEILPYGEYKAINSSADQFPEFNKWVDRVYNRSYNRIPSSYLDDIQKQATIERAKAYDIINKSDRNLYLVSRNISDKISDNGILIGDYAMYNINPSYKPSKNSLEIITTTNRYPKLLESLDIPYQELHQGQNVIKSNGQQYTIQVLGNNGSYAHDLFAFSKPKEYFQFINRLADRAVGEHNKAVLNNNVKEFETFNQNIPISEEELFDIYLNDPQLQNDYTKSKYLFGVTDKDKFVSSKLMRDPDLESTTPIERKNLYLKSRLVLSNPLRIVSLDPQKMITQDYLSNAIGTNVTANNLFTSDHSAGNTLYQASRGGVHGSLLSNAPMPQRKMRYVQVLENILKTNENRLPEEVMDKFTKFSDKMKEAKTVQQMESIMRQANNYAAHNHLYGFIGGEYSYLRDAGNPNPLFFGKFRSGSYGLPIFTSSDVSAKMTYPVLQTGSIPLKKYSNIKPQITSRDSYRLNELIGVDYKNLNKAESIIRNHYYPIQSSSLQWDDLIDRGIISIDDVPQMFIDYKGNVNRTLDRYRHIKGLPKNVAKELVMKMLPRIDTSIPYEKVYYNKLIQKYQLPVKQLPYTMYDYSYFMYKDFFNPKYDAKLKFKQAHGN